MSPDTFLRLLLRRPLGLIAAGWLLLAVGGSLAAPLIAPYSSTEADLACALSTPTGQHLLGCDSQGRDVLSRLLFGGTVSLEGVLIAAGVFVLLGVSLGLLAGYVGRWVDWSITRASDLSQAIPAVVILLVILSIYPANRYVPMLTFGILGVPGLMRVVRAATLSTREELYVDAARTFGLSPARIVLRHILPRILSQIIVQAAMFAGLALIVQAGLAFLGFGPKPPAASWGDSVGDASQVITRDPWLLVPTGLIIAVTALALGLLGDAVRDASTQRWSASRLGTSPAGTTKKLAATAPPVAATPSADALLSVRGLVVEFSDQSGPFRTVSDVSFDIRAGEALGVVGESGCGKTMTSMGVLGLLPAGGRLTGGTVVFDGVDLRGLDAEGWARVRGRGIGYVSQEPMVALDPTFTVGSQLSEAVRRHRKVGRREARAIAAQLLEQVRLPDPSAVYRLYPHQLSGGIAQRAAIALALAGQPRLLIADEPTTALDVSVQAEILALLHTLRRDTGLAVLLVTHDWGVVADLCDRAVVMYAGQVVEYGEVTDIFAAPSHPYTAALLASNLQTGAARTAPLEIGTRPPPLPTIPGSVPRPQDWPPGCHFQDRCPHVKAVCRAQPIEAVELADGRVTRCVRVPVEEGSAR